MVAGDRLELGGDKGVHSCRLIGCGAIGVGKETGLQ